MLKEGSSEVHIRAVRYCTSLKMPSEKPVISHSEHRVVRPTQLTRTTNKPRSATVSRSADVKGETKYNNSLSFHLSSVNETQRYRSMKKFTTWKRSEYAFKIWNSCSLSQSFILKLKSKKCIFSKNAYKFPLKPIINFIS